MQEVSVAPHFWSTLAASSGTIPKAEQMGSQIAVWNVLFNESLDIAVRKAVDHPKPSLGSVVAKYIQRSATKKGQRR
jgi:hypothetical protein